MGSCPSLQHRAHEHGGTAGVADRVAEPVEALAGIREQSRVSDEVVCLVTDEEGFGENDQVDLGGVAGDDVARLCQVAGQVTHRRVALGDEDAQVSVMPNLRF